MGRPPAPRGPHRGPLPAGLAQHLLVALVADDDRGARDVQAQAQVVAAQLLGAGQDDRAEAKAGHHRDDPFGAVADERQDDVTAPHAYVVQAGGERPRVGRDLAERPLAPPAVAGELDERQAPWRRRADDVSGEVHLGAPQYPGCMAVETQPFTDRTDEQKAISEMVRQFADEQILPNAEHYDHEDEFPEPIVEQMKELGLFGVTIPEEYGGMGLDLTTYVMIVEELSRGWISISGVINTHFIGSYLLQKYGTDEQKQKYLPRMATGEIRAAFSLSEPELGSDVQAIKTSAKKLDDGTYEINGQKMWVTNGLMSVARLRARQDRPDADPRHRGFTCFIAEKEAGVSENTGDYAGLTVPPKIKKLGYKGVESTELVFDGYKLPGREHPRRRGGAASTRASRR